MVKNQIHKKIILVFSIFATSFNIAVSQVTDSDSLPASQNTIETTYIPVSVPDTLDSTSTNTDRVDVQTNQDSGTGITDPVLVATDIYIRECDAAEIIHEQARIAAGTDVISSNTAKANYRNAIEAAGVKYDLAIKAINTALLHLNP